MFNKGNIVVYSKTGQKAIILNVHYDDVLPYYTIMTNNREVQTIEKYLKKEPLKTRKRKRSSHKKSRKN